MKLDADIETETEAGQMNKQQRIWAAELASRQPVIMGGAHVKGLTDAWMNVHNGGQVAVMRVIFWKAPNKRQNQAQGVSALGSWSMVVWTLLSLLSYYKQLSEKQ